MSGAAPDFGPVVLGTNAFGWTADRDAAFAVLDAFLDAGGRAIDTADVYPGMGSASGASEAIVGDWLASRGVRDRVLVTTKVGNWRARPGLSAGNVTAAVEDSLRRLRTDHLDVYYAHADDPSQTPEQIAATFHRLVQTGKTAAVGASNFTPARLRSLAGALAALGTPLRASQDHYNLIERRFETALAPTLTELGIPELPYQSLAGGVLTGKYRDRPRGDSARGQFAAGLAAAPHARAAVTQLSAIADRHQVSPAAVALAWLRAQPTVVAPIAGARAPAQLTPLIEAFSLTLEADELDSLRVATQT